MENTLVIDLGNSRTKLGFFKQRRFLKKMLLENTELVRLPELIQGMKIDRAIFSSVNHEAVNFIDLNAFDFPCMRLNSDSKLPFNYNYKTIETLGTDRIAVTAAGQKLYPGQNLLLIDAGSCITYDFLTKSAIYEGGAISPGIKMRLKAMHHFTKALPLKQWDGTHQPNVLGDSTENSILSGAINGAVAEIDGYISFYKQQYNAVKTVITGGDAKFFEKAVKNTIFADPNLVLKGLNELLIYNGE